MSLSKMSGSDVESLTEQWRNERSLCRDVTFPKYSNADERKAALSRISQQIQMDGVAPCIIKLDCCYSYVCRHFCCYVTH